MNALGQIRVDRVVDSHITPARHIRQQQRGENLGYGEELGSFDSVVANPPYEGAQDIAHIKHAVNFLKPRGRLVVLCANGPRQSRELGALAEEHGGTFEPLPEGTFAAEGTNVRVALLVIEKDE